VKKESEAAQVRRYDIMRLAQGVKLTIDEITASIKMKPKDDE